MVVFPLHGTRLNHTGFECNLYSSEVQSGICSFVAIKVATATKMFSTNGFSILIGSRELEAGRFNLYPSYLQRQAGRHR